MTTNSVPAAVAPSIARAARRAALAAAAFLALSLPAAAQMDGHGPDAWRVVNVASNDVLNARIGPAVDYDRIAALPPNAIGVQVRVCVPTVSQAQYMALDPANQSRLNAMTPWCLVFWQNRQIGWVNRNYLQPM